MEKDQVSIHPFIHIWHPGLIGSSCFHPSTYWNCYCLERMLKDFDFDQTSMWSLWTWFMQDIRGFCSPRVRGPSASDDVKMKSHLSVSGYICCSCYCDDPAESKMALNRSADILLQPVWHESRPQRVSDKLGSVTCYLMSDSVSFTWWTCSKHSSLSSGSNFRIHSFLELLSKTTMQQTPEEAREFFDSVLKEQMLNAVNIGNWHENTRF